MKETLECTQCDIKWERKKTRGRKPIVCPSCAEVNAQEENSAKTKLYKPSIEQESEVECKYPAVSHWICDICEQTVSVHIGLNYPPVHNCRLKRNQVITMQQTTRQKLKEITA